MVSIPEPVPSQGPAVDEYEAAYLAASLLIQAAFDLHRVLMDDDRGVPWTLVTLIGTAMESHEDVSIEVMPHIRHAANMLLAACDEFEKLGAGTEAQRRLTARLIGAAEKLAIATLSDLKAREEE